MNQSKIYLLNQQNYDGVLTVVGYTTSEEFAIKWCEEEYNFREYEEIEEIRV